MEDVFYLCPEKITFRQIQNLFQKHMHDCTELIGYTDDQRLQIQWQEFASPSYIEFYLFPEYMQYMEKEEIQLMRKAIQTNHVQTVIGILHHTRHIPVVLRYVSMLMQEFGGVLGTDHYGFQPYFTLFQLKDFQYGYD